MAETPARRYLTTDEVADRFRTSAGTVRYWRHMGKGPASFKVGRRVLYDLALVEKWESDLERAQYAAAGVTA